MGQFFEYPYTDTPEQDLPNTPPDDLQALRESYVEDEKEEVERVGGTMTPLSESRLRGLAEALGFKVKHAEVEGDYIEVQIADGLTFPQPTTWFVSPDGAFFILGEINQLAPPTQQKNTRKEFYDALFRVINTEDPMLVLFYMTPTRIAQAAADALEIE